MNFADEVLYHFLRDFKISNHPIAQWADGLDVPRRPAKHHLGLFTHGLDHLFALARSYGHHRGFVQDDATTFNVDQGIGSPEVNGHIRG